MCREWFTGARFLHNWPPEVVGAPETVTLPDPAADYAEVNGIERSRQDVVIQDGHAYHPVACDVLPPALQALATYVAEAVW